MENQSLRLSVGDFIALTNQTLEFAYPSIEVEGEVSGFKLNQGKFVFFDLKDSEGSVGCFMMVFNLRIPIEDGMKVIVRANPKLTKWGKFSLTIQAIRPSGEGSLKKSFEILKAKLDTEGLFSPERKRHLPVMPGRVAVISSTQAAGYADFVKIMNDRWGGVNIDVASVQVQGEVAADQIMRAIKYFNEQKSLPDILVIIRGGGSADDLSVFNDELLVREIAGSRIPIVTGIGHETDESLSDLVADVAAATPSNVAQIIVPDRHDKIRSVRQSLRQIVSHSESAMTTVGLNNRRMIERAYEQIEKKYDRLSEEYVHRRDTLKAFNPQNVLKRGYALVRGDVSPGGMIDIETRKQYIIAEVKNVKER